MTINSELLKSAIADAKAVRAIALANAKASLEEAFAPRFEAMFAEKLKEEAEDGTEEMMSEVEAPNQVSGKGGEAKGPATKPVTQGQPKKVSDAASNFKTVAVGGSEGAAGSNAPAATQSIVKEEEELSSEENVEDMEEAGLTTEDLDQIIKELEAEVSGEESEEMPVAPVAAGPEVSVSDEMPAADVTTDVQPSGEVDVNTAPEVDVEQPVQVPSDEAGGEEEINLEELLAALNEEADKEDEDEEKEEIDEISNNGVPTDVKGQDADMKNATTASKNQGGDIGSGEVGGKPKMEEGKYKVALQEAYNTISFLRGQINEVNLLNAKLLYTNKLFKEFAGILDDSYRMKIVESFDLTKSVREVKLAYALLAESLNFGKSTNSKAASKPVIKKSVTQITEGLASKPVASTKPSKELISEGNEMALRFKKLAGIKEAKK